VKQHDRIAHSVSPNHAGCRSYLAGRVVNEAPALASALGYFYFVFLLKRVRAAPHIIVQAWAKAWTRKESKRE
jgi:hypothetical protein